LFFVLTLRRTGSLWFAVGMHTSWNWGQTFFYSVANSGFKAPGHLLSSSFHGPDWLTGGTVGPEASLLVFVLIGLMTLLFHWRYPVRAQERLQGGPGPAPTILSS
jgi:membrane protease YdiL (CAAX protease family)